MAFVFMYPIDGYLQGILHIFNFLDMGFYPGDLAHYINKEYRSKNHKVYWVIPKDTPSTGPKGISSYLQPRTSDIILTADLTLDEMFTGRYADADAIVNTIEGEIILGGFHYHSCVRSVYEVAIRMGRHASIDRFATELFFAR